MGNPVDQAKAKVRLNKESLATDVNRFEDRVGYLTNVPAQLRRHWPKVVAAGAISVGVIAGLGWRKRHAHKRPLGDSEMAAQLEALKQELAASKHDSLGRKVAMRATTAVATAVGTLVARRIADHLFAEDDEPDDQGQSEEESHRHGRHAHDTEA